MPFHDLFFSIAGRTLYDKNTFAPPSPPTLLNTGNKRRAILTIGDNMQQIF